MSQHYTRNTVSAAAWCPKCRKETQHTVSDRRTGYCIDCMDRFIDDCAARADKQRKETEPPAVPERGLFDEEPTR